ncbi:glycosyltransferase family 4 protein [Salinibacter grassmerensis]|uniref:glycosyltransferase family 4 protein n=1 Tax=Salinibacter grassmerensis TaxID=3040353 RepID=UPI0021E92177|nr:glycosyltransferase family 4 protein [Salinibacter grassmerensis]
MKEEKRLAVIHTHPIQYLAPLYREVQRQGIPVTAIYASDFSIAGYEDEEFGTSVAWETDLLSGYEVRFLERSEEEGASSVSEASVGDLWRVLSEVEPDAIMLSAYYPQFHSLAFLITIAYTFGQDPKLLLRAETTDHAENRGQLTKILRDFLLSFLYSFCDHFAYIGRRSRNHYERLGMDEKSLSFSPYSVNTDVFSESEKEREELRREVRREIGSRNQFVLLYVGKISERKGVDLIIKAAGGLSDQERQEWTILFVGEGEMEDDLRREAQERRVDTHFAGFQKQSRLSRFYHAADAFVLPSRRGETWGLVVNEALHHGVPAIVSDQVGCAPDLIDEGTTGEVFRSGDVGELREAMVKVKSQHERGQEMRKKIRSYVGNYSIEESARGVVNALKREWE